MIVPSYYIASGDIIVALSDNCMCVRIIVHNCRTQQSTEPAVLIIFPVFLQTIIMAQMTSTGGKGVGAKTLLALSAEFNA